MTKAVLLEFSSPTDFSECPNPTTTCESVINNIEKESTRGERGDRWRRHTAEKAS